MEAMGVKDSYGGKKVLGEKEDDGGDGVAPAPQPFKVLGRRWSIPIIRELRNESLDDVGFMDLKRRLEKVSSKVLSERLKQLVKQDFIERKELDHLTPKRVNYHLTERGSLACRFMEELNPSSSS